MPTTIENQIIIELIKAGFALLVGLTSLLVTWQLGQRILLYWEARKKRQELDITTSNQFQDLYGEFRTILRLWQVLKHHKEKITPPDPDHTRWELLNRATVTEGSIEAIILKLAKERELDNRDITTLGLFRQAFQILRQAIRDDDPLSNYHEPAFRMFHELYIKVSIIIDKRQTRSKIDDTEITKTISGIHAF